MLRVTGSTASISTRLLNMVECCPKECAFRAKSSKLNNRRTYLCKSQITSAVWRAVPHDTTSLTSDAHSDGSNGRAH